MLFYLAQYTLTAIASFFVLLGLGYVLKRQHNTVYNTQRGDANDITLISTLAGHANTQPMLALSMLVCLFSMAGVPPMVGFFAKYNVLYVAMLNGHHAIALLGVVTSVISAAYYLRIVRVLYFDRFITSNDASVPGIENLSYPLPGSTSLTAVPQGGPGVQSATIANSYTSLAISSLHSYVIACLTMFMLLFMLQPAIMLNSTQLLAMTLYTG
jgi:NADH-ubiquinone oxidoreductase chain 2